MVILVILLLILLIKSSRKTGQLREEIETLEEALEKKQTSARQARCEYDGW